MRNPLSKPAIASASSLVRSLSDAAADYAAAKDLLTKLRASLTKLDREDDDIRFRLFNRKPGAEKTNRVAALLGEAVDDDNVAPDGLTARLREIASERVDLRAAIEIAQQRVSAARHGASKIICAEVRADYAARVVRIAKALVEAAEANTSLVDLVNDLEREDVAFTGYLAPMQATTFVGFRGERVAAYLRDSVAAGFIEKNEIPKELQQ